ncbi:MAG: hypothetical protein M5U22_10600 [Thermoleophilia bacterium]|nr:hypothetical protein [Thermoleophilia bacterium]
MGSFVATCEAGIDVGIGKGHLMSACRARGSSAVHAVGLQSHGFIAVLPLELNLWGTMPNAEEFEIIDDAGTVEPAKIAYLSVADRDVMVDVGLFLSRGHPRHGDLSGKRIAGVPGRQEGPPGCT